MVAAHKNRKNPRAQVSLVARYRSPTAFDFVAEECHDLSAGGMFICSPAPAPAGTLLKLECDVDRGQAAIRAVARVVWLREQDNQDEPAGMGVKFVKLDPGAREIITKLLEETGNDDGAGPEARGSSMPAPAPLIAASDVPASKEPASDEVVANPASDEVGATKAEPALAPAAEAVTATDAEPAPAAAPAIASSEPASTPEPSAKPETVATPPAAAAISAAPGKPIAAAARAPSDANRTPVMVGAALLLGVVVISLAGRKERAPEPDDAMPAVSAADGNEHAPTRETGSQRDQLAVDHEPAKLAPDAAPQFVLQLTTIPDAARVTIGQQTVVTPNMLELGTLTAPIEVRAEKDGFEPVTATIELDRFSEREGRRVATVTLALPPLPRDEEPAAVAVPVAAPEASKPVEVKAPAKPEPAKPEPAKPATVAREARRTSAASAASVASAPRPQTPSAPPLTVTPAAKPTEAAVSAPADAPKQTPLQAAMACLSRGDNACVIDALEGKARATGELELLIETYRAMGNSAAAERHMSTYVEKFPSERRAAGYRRLLSRDAPSDTPAAPAAETPAATPVSAPAP